MPTRPTKVTLDTNVMNIMNALRNNASNNYKDYVPPMTDVSELRQIGKIIMDVPAIQNEFLSALINRIALVRITSKMFDNPWSRFKKGFLEYGETIEEVFVDLINVYQFDAEKAETELFKRVNPDVRAAFHVMNYQKFYKVTIERQKLAKAFLSASGMNDLITYIMTAIYTSASYDEFLTMKYMLARNILNCRMYPIEIDAVAEANMKSIVATVKGTSNLLEFPSRKYNPAGVFQHTDKENQYILIDANFDAQMDVNVLASAFNMDRAQFMGNRVLIDGFGTLDNERLAELFADDPYYVEITEDEMTALNQIPLAVVDENFWMVYDNLNEFREVENGQGLYWNYFYHQWKTFSTSPFSNAIVYVPTTPAVTSVTVTPESATVSAGTSLALTTTVVTTGYAPQTVTYSSNNDKVTITEGGVVQIDADATGTATITITSTFDATKSDTVTLTIS
ncbi:MAG: Ig-like domain-containing protein [Cellulosilyticum sp.]|nr:Ig-like domain-containing protein [Cellulosilyticum sp.]